jgi:hypothetical protein
VPPDGEKREEPISELEDLPDEHFEAIGRVAEAWAAVEMLIDTCCWELAGVRPNIAACFTAQVIGPGRKLDALISLVKVQGGGDAVIRSLNKFATKSQGLAERRNRVVHDVWLPSLEGPQRYEVTAKKVLRIGFFTMATREINDLLREIEAHFAVLKEIRSSALSLLLLTREE